MENLTVSKVVAYNQLCKELDELYQLYAKKRGISESALWILYCVYERQDAYTQKELCREWSYSRQTVNSTLKSLEARGLIELRPFPGNRKNKQIFLTPSGKELVGKIVDPLMEAEKNAFARLGEAETDEYLRLARRHTELFREEVNKILDVSSEDF